VNPDRVGRPSPVRRCIGCRRRAPQHELLRTVGEADGAIAVGRRRPGRGAWLCPDPTCWSAAARSRAWDRALRRRTGPATVAATDPAAVAALIAPDGPLRQLTDALGLGAQPAAPDVRR
jgi:predicted RNA-binding protein YlxR (DUF448 family)